MRKPRKGARIIGMKGQSFKKPRCKQCEEEDFLFDATENVVRYMGMWVCNKHMQIRNTKFVPSLVELPIGILEEEKPLREREFITLRELLVNRAHRRSMGHMHAHSEAA